LQRRHCHYPNFHCHYYQRYQNVHLHITHTKYHPLSEHSYAKPRLQLKEGRQENKEGLNQLSLCCSLILLKIGVCSCVTWDPNILHQAVNNPEVISELDQLTNACAGRRVRKQWKTWPVNKAWDSNHIFFRGQMAKC